MPKATWDPAPVLSSLSVEATFAVLLYGECRDMDLKGKVAVANVVVNRLARTCHTLGQAPMDAKPELWKRIMLNPWDFSCFDNDGGALNYTRVVEYATMLRDQHPPPGPLTIELSVLVNLAMKGLLVDITNGSTHYHTVTLAPPRWARGETPTYRDRSHVFYGLDDARYDLW